MSELFFGIGSGVASIFDFAANLLSVGLRMLNSLGPLAWSDKMNTLSYASGMN